MKASTDPNRENYKSIGFYICRWQQALVPHTSPEQPPEAYAILLDSGVPLAGPFETITQAAELVDAVHQIDLELYELGRFCFYGIGEVRTPMGVVAPALYTAQFLATFLDLREFAAWPYFQEVRPA